MKKIQVIIIDDERAAREELKSALKAYLDFELLGEAKNADEAKQQIETLRPDLIFLDIQMPEKSGFDLLESLDAIPAVIFTTAFDQYAVQAFEINAVDYLVKPIREERFAKAIGKIREKLLGSGAARQSIPMNRQLFIRDGEKYYFVYPTDIYLIESLDNYSRLYFNNTRAILKRSLRQWESLLDPALFFRINRTQLVNMRHIQHAESLEKGKLIVVLLTGQQLEVSGRQSAKFRELNGL